MPLHFQMKKSNNARHFNTENFVVTLKEKQNTQNDP